MLGRGTLNTCAKFQGLSLKNGVDITLKEFGVICLKQPTHYLYTVAAGWAGDWVLSLQFIYLFTEAASSERTA